MSIMNPAPMELRVNRVETGYRKSKIYFATNNILDSDIASLVVWNRESAQLKADASRTDTDYLEGLVELQGLTESTVYTATVSLLDDFIYTDGALVSDRYLSGTEDLFNMQDVSYSTKEDIAIINSEITSTSREIGNPTSNLRLEISGEADTIVCERKLDTSSTWEVFYSGEFSNSIAASFMPGVYDIRVRGFINFSDGTVESGNYSTDSIDINSDSTNAPNPVTNISKNAYLITGSSSTYDLRIEWDQDNTTGGVVRDFIVYLLENPNEVSDLTTLDWSQARREVTTTPDIAYDAFPYRRTYAIRIETNGWGSQSSAALYTSVYISKDVSESTKLGYLVPSELPFVTDTKIQVTDEFIRGYSIYDADTPANNNKTFEIDAATGNVVIGSAGTYADGTTVTSPFVFDAINNQLQISGKTITDSIISADFIMGWLSGSAPTFRTANKAGYADANSGIWMGYSGVDTFKVDIGSASQYIRWDGQELNISGDVKIGNSNQTLGQTQKQVFIYRRAASQPTTPTTGSFSSPIPTDWNTTIETGTDPVWMTHRIFTSTGADPQETTWAEPTVFARDGNPGDTLYTWIKYADSSTGAGLSDSPEGKDFIGVAYNKTSATESTDPTDYTWSEVKGDSGSRGPGSFERGVSGLIAWSDTEALNAIQDKYGVGAVAVPGDSVTLYNLDDVSNENNWFTRVYNSSSSWETFNVQIHGSLLVDDTIKARHVAADILTGKALTATFIQTRETNQTGTPRVVISGSNSIGGPPAQNPLRIFDANNNPILNFSEDGVLQFTGGLGPSTIDSLSAFSPGVLQHILPSEGTGGAVVEDPQDLVTSGANTITITLQNANSNQVGVNAEMGDYAFRSHFIGTEAQAIASMPTPSWNVTIRRDSSTGPILHNQDYTGAVSSTKGERVTETEYVWIQEMTINAKAYVEDNTPNIVSEAITYVIIITHLTGFTNNPRFKGGDVSQATVGSGAVSLLGLNDVDFPNALPVEGETLVYNGTTEQWENIVDPRLSDARQWTASIVTQSEAEGGTATTARKWTAQRVKQAAIAGVSGSYSPVGHGHLISDVSGLQTALNSKLSTAGKAADSDKLDGINSSQFIRNDQTGQSITGSLRINTHALISAPTSIGSGNDVSIITDQGNYHTELRVLDNPAGIVVRNSTDSGVSWTEILRADSSGEFKFQGQEVFHKNNGPGWNDVQNKPTEYPPESHSHGLSDVTFADQEVKTTSNVEFNSTKIGGFKMEYDSDTESLSFNFVGV